MAKPFIAVGQRVTYRVDRLGEQVARHSEHGPWLHGGDTGEVTEYHVDPFGDPEDDWATVLITARDGRTQQLAISPDYVEHGKWLVLEPDCECGPLGPTSRDDWSADCPVHGTWASRGR